MSCARDVQINPVAVQQADSICGFYARTRVSYQRQAIRGSPDMAGGAAPAQLLVKFENAGSLFYLGQAAGRDAIKLGLRARSQEGRAPRVRTKSLGQARVPTGGGYRCYSPTTASPINL